MISSRKNPQDFISIPDEMEKLKTIATVNVVKQWYWGKKRDYTGRDLYLKSNNKNAIAFKKNDYL